MKSIFSLYLLRNGINIFFFYINGTILANNMSKVIRIGTDIHQLSRFLSILQRNGPLSTYKTKRFSEKILNPKYELPKFEEFRLSNNLEQCAQILSVSWCIKEAIYKTLDDTDQNTFIMNQWYKSNDERGRPIIGCENYNKPNEEFLCSISHDGDLVSSFILRQQK